MNKIWLGISITCLIYGLITGRFDELANSILLLPEDALSLTITLIVSA